MRNSQIITFIQFFMTLVRAKKHLGQHFLTDKNIAEKIVRSLSMQFSNTVLEVGPGMGILSDFLFQNEALETWLVDIDTESIAFLHKKYVAHQSRIIEADFLKLDFETYFKHELSIIGNFPYNISSQIIFKILENKQLIPEMVGMFQKEVAERCVAHPKSKEYGILSVFLQAYYDVSYLFTVKPTVFNPAPKVNSAVIRIQRKEKYTLDCNEVFFWQIVKAGFNQRRKTLRNALSSIVPKSKMTDVVFDRRAETLSVEEFVGLTNRLSL